MKSAKREYRMTVAGQLFKHLGLQMYSGAVPAISELISNAYDAMAKNVWITLPTGRPIQQTDEIIVKDDGHGMSFEECNSHYLSVGRNRRSGESEWTKAYNGLKPRKVQGRKGIGKLAGFGVAERIDIRTLKDKQVAHFALDFIALTKSPNFADERGYVPETLSGDGTRTGGKPGTTVGLTQLKISRAIDEEEFKRGRQGGPGRHQETRPPEGWRLAMSRWPGNAQGERTTFGGLRRGQLMSRVRSTGNQTTEKRLASLLREAGLTGWRRHQFLPGRPDFVWPKIKVAVFVDGCFWHGHDCGRNLTPQTNAKAWCAKIEGNQARDRRTSRFLRQQGWSVIRVWECQLARTPALCVSRIAKTLGRSDELWRNGKLRDDTA